MAEVFMAALLELNSRFDKVAEIADGIEDTAEREATLSRVATLVLDSYEQLMRPVIRQYSDLDPDKFDGSGRIDLCP